MNNKMKIILIMCLILIGTGCFKKTVRIPAINKIENGFNSKVPLGKVDTSYILFNNEDLLDKEKFINEFLAGNPLDVSKIKEGPDVSWDKLKTVAFLNKLLAGSSLYSSVKERRSRLSQKTINLAKKNPSGRELELLNRWILEDCFPECLKQSRRDMQGAVYVYIQGTGSMVGFLSGRSSEYLRCLRIFRIGSCFGGSSSEIFRYGLVGKGELYSSSIEEAAMDDYYHLSQNDMSGVLELLTEKSPSELPETVALITNGVNNAEGFKKESKLIKQISRMIKLGYYFDIIAVESSFKGPVWSIIKADRGEEGYIGTYEGRKLFFVYLFSRKQSQGVKITEHLRDVSPPMHVYHFQVIRETGPLVIKNDVKTKTTNLWRYGNSREKLENGFLSLKKKSRDKETAVCEFSVENFHYKNNDIEVVWMNPVTDEITDDFCSVKLSNRKESPSTLRLTIDDSKFPDNSVSACRVSILNEIPSWINDFSTQNDEVKDELVIEGKDSRKVLKTLFLRETIDSITQNEDFKTFPYKYFYLIVKG